MIIARRLNDLPQLSVSEAKAWMVFLHMHSCELDAQIRLCKTKT
jgi:hypothetical protein